MNIKRGQNVLGTQLYNNLTFGTMYGKNLKMVKSKNRRTIKAPARLIAADDEAQVLTRVEMKDENAQVANRPYYKDVIYDLESQNFDPAEHAPDEHVEVSGGSSCEGDEMDDDNQYDKEVY